MKNVKPEVFVLDKVAWQFFGTLTFRQAKLPERVRVVMVFATMRNLARCLGLHFRNLQFVLRMEAGETFGRLHFHFLLGGVPNWAVNETTCLTTMSLWEKAGGGMSRCRLFDQGRAGLDYITECLGAGPDLYESAKFGSGACELMLSESVQGLRAINRTGANLAPRSRPSKGDYQSNAVFTAKKRLARQVAHTGQ